MVSKQSFQSSYPWGWLNDVRDVVVLTATSPDQGQSTIPAAEGAVIVNPPYARVAIQVSLDGTICQTPWFPMDVSPLFLPIPNQIRREFEVLIQAREGIAVTSQEFGRGDFDRTPFN